MSKSNSTTPRVKTIGVQIKPNSAKRVREIERLHSELAPIVRLTASGDFTAWNLYIWNLVISKCRDRLNKFDGVNEATESVADAFAEAVGRISAMNRKDSSQ